MMTALIADDEPHLAAYLQEQLAALWPELRIVHVARHGLDAARQIAALQPDLAFLDIRMPGLTGLEVYCEVEELAMGSIRTWCFMRVTGHSGAGR